MSRELSAGHCGLCGYEADNFGWLGVHVYKAHPPFEAHAHCATDGCTRPHYAKGLCNLCYQRRNRALKKAAGA